VSEIRNEHSTKEVILQEIKSIPGNLDNVYVFLICTLIQIKFDVRKRQIFKLVTTALIIPLCLEKNQVSSLCICSIIWALFHLAWCYQSNLPHSHCPVFEHAVFKDVVICAVWESPRIGLKRETSSIENSQAISNISCVDKFWRNLITCPVLKSFHAALCAYRNNI